MAGAEIAAGDIMAGGERIGPELAGEAEQVAELHGAIALDAGDRRLAGEIALGEALDHRVAEAALIVEHVMRNADRLGDAAGVVDILAGAAGAGAVHGFAMVVELQGDADDVIALALQQRRHHRGVDAARHGRDDACGRRRLGDVERVERNGHQGSRRVRARSVRGFGRSIAVLIDAGQHPAGNSCRVASCDDVIPAGSGIESNHSRY